MAAKLAKIQSIQRFGVGFFFKETFFWVQAEYESRMHSFAHKDSPIPAFQDMKNNNSANFCITGTKGKTSEITAKKK